MIKKVSVTNVEDKNTESWVARVEPINRSLGNNRYAKNRNAGMKRINHTKISHCRVI
jgi:hypothetical protein